jgi:DNA primase
MRFYQNPLAARPEQPILEFYSKHYDLINELLVRVGADHIRSCGNYYTSTCPLHRGDNPKGFVVYCNQESPVFICLTRCKLRGPLHKMVTHAMHCDDMDALRLMANIAGLPFDGKVAEIDIEDLSLRMAKESLKRSQIGSTSSKFVQPAQFTESMVWQSLSQPRPPFFELRGIPSQVLDLFQVGYVPGGAWVWPKADPCTGQQTVNATSGRPEWTGWFEDRVSIPIRFADGNLAGFSGRRIADSLTKDATKYKILYGTPKEHLLYGLHQPQTVEMIRRTRQVILVEGFAAVWRAWQHGHFNTVAIIGSSLNPLQLKVLAPFPIDSIALYFDADEAGYTCASNAENLVKSSTRIQTVYVASPPQGLDPGDLSDRAAFEAPLMSAFNNTLRKDLMR